MPNKKTWVNVLPLKKWHALVGLNNQIEGVFQLHDFQIHPGSAECVIKLLSGPTVSCGLMEEKLFDSLLVRLYSPIEVHQIPRNGLAPKMAYILPKTHHIECYQPKVFSNQITGTAEGY